MDSVFARLTRFFHSIHVTASGIHLSAGRHNVFGSRHGAFVAVAMTLSVVVLGILIAIIQYRRNVALRDRLTMIRKLNDGLRTSGTIEDNLNHILAVASEVIVAPYYAFYIWDRRATRYTLRAASHPYDLFEGVGPSYSGLALPKKEVYLPPSVLELPQMQGTVQLVKDGEVPLLLVRMGELSGLMRIGPVTQINRRQRRLLTEFGDSLVNTIEDFINLENDRLKVELKALSDGAVNKIASLASNTLGTIDILLNAFTGIVGGTGGLFLQRDDRGTISVYAPDSLLSLVQDLEADEDGLRGTMEGRQPGVEEIVLRNDPEFYTLPMALTSRDDVGAVVFVPFGPDRLLVMLQDRKFNPSAWKALGSRQLNFLTQQVNRMTNQIPVQQAFTRSYTRLLCEIADFVDNLNPYTVGYSDMLTHYALAVGHTMGLPDGEMTDLAMAARLSNIGVIGMDTALLVKEGRYNDFEYNLMKRHSEISASMIELVTGNKRAADYVLYHHERVDGEGYPMRLSGSDIPVPSKIIHMLQVLFAKVNGRSWRAPLTFEAALRELNASVGSSLDGDVVSAFERWWEKQGQRPIAQEANLGFCYEMCCVPKSICEGCPAFQHPTRCWEMEDNHCKFHGRECSTCFVRTEYEYRMAKS